MACPSGCLNGGGQIKPQEKGPQASKELVKKLDQVRTWSAFSSGVLAATHIAL